MARSQNWKSFTPEEVELSIAWLRGEIPLIRVTGARDGQGIAGTYVFLAQALKQALSQGILKVDRGRSKP